MFITLYVGASELWLLGAIVSSGDWLIDWFSNYSFSYVLTYLLIFFTCSEVRRSEHITSVLEHLHRLHVSQRAVFKTALMVWKCVHGVAPAYLSDLCVPATSISGRQHLRSAATGTLLVPRTRTATGQRSFAVNGPAIWNHLSQC